MSPDTSTVRSAPHAQSLAVLHGAVVLFGFAGLFGKWIDLSPVLIVLGRTAVAAAALAVFGLYRGRSIGRLDLRMVACGAVLALHWVTFFAAIQTASVAVGLLGYAAFPLFTLVLERVMLQRPLRSTDAITALLVVSGLVLVVPHWTVGDAVVQGLAWGLVSAFTFALLAVLNRTLAARRRATEVALWQNASAALCLLPFAATALAAAAPTARDLLLVLVLAVACTALAHTLFIASLRTLTAHTASVVAALEPAYGMLLAWTLLGEAPTPRMWAGGALLIGAAIVASRASRPAAVSVVAPRIVRGRARRV